MNFSGYSMFKDYSPLKTGFLFSDKKYSILVNGFSSFP